MLESELVLDFIKANPFHRVNVSLIRLLGINTNLPGGDCYQLACDFHLKYNIGSLTFCRYIGSEDTHTVLMLEDDSYIDFTNWKNPITSRDSPHYFKKFIPTSPIKDYWTPRKNSLDTMFTGCVWVNSRKCFASVRGDTIFYPNSPSMVLPIERVISNISFMFSIPKNILNRLLEVCPGYFTFRDLYL